MSHGTEVAVVGGGLAGLCTARLLHRAGLDVQLFEANDRLGGRVLSTDETGAPAEDGFDLGASWFWPRRQPALAALIEDLDLAAFPQNFAGDVIFERMSRETPQRYRPVDQDDQSMRLVGGTAALVARIARDLPAARLHRGARVTAIRLDQNCVTITVRARDGATREIEALQVAAAMPPRLLEATVAFEPALEPGTRERWRATSTWMAPHAKFLAFYDRPFWRDAGLSGTAQSFVGPLAEIHDASTASGRAALLGFLAVGADGRAAMGKDVLTAACIAQVQRLFGAEAGRPRATLVKDWANDDLTATSTDRSAGAHPPSSAMEWVAAPWRDRLVLASSETSTEEAGFLAGAVASARAAATLLEDRLASDRRARGG